MALTKTIGFRRFAVIFVSCILLTIGLAYAGNIYIDSTQIVGTNISYSNVLNHPADVEPYSYLIGVFSNGSYYAVNGTNGQYVNSWTSTNANTTVNNAVTALINGGIIYFNSGTFPDVNPKIETSNIQLIGSGYSTVINNTSSDASDVNSIEVLGSVLGYIDNVVISNMRLVGVAINSTAKSGDAIEAEYTNDLRIENIWIESAGEEGFFGTYCNNTILNNYHISNCGASGIDLREGCNNTKIGFGTLEHNAQIETTEAEIMIDPPTGTYAFDCTIKGATIYTNSSQSIKIVNVKRLTISECTVHLESVSTAFYIIANVTDSLFSGNTILAVTAGGGRVGYYLMANTVTENAIIGNVIMDTTTAIQGNNATYITVTGNTLSPTGYGIDMNDGSADYWTISGNSLKSGSNAYSGTHNKIRDVPYTGTTILSEFWSPGSARNCTDGTAWLVPITVREYVNITKAGIICTTAGTATFGAFAVYSDNSGVPNDGTMLTNSSATAVSASTRQEITVTAYLLSPGRYWLAFATNNTNCQCSGPAAAILGGGTLKYYSFAIAGGFAAGFPATCPAVSAANAPDFYAVVS